MKLRLFVAALAVLVLVGSGLITEGCSKSNSEMNPRIEVATDLAGKTIKVGDTINLSWRCEECDDITGDSVLVKLCTDVNGAGYCDQQVAFGPLTGSASWTVGTVLGGTGWYPTSGFYKLSFRSYPPSVGTVEPYFPRDAWGETGTFQIVR